MTGSVSTVIVLGGSDEALGFPVLRLVKDRFASSEAGLDALGALDLWPFSALLAFDLDGPSPPLPSPSLATDVSGCGSVRWSRGWTAIFWSDGEAGTGPIDGVVGRLLSATVSRALGPAPGPRPKERRPEWVEDGSWLSGICMAAAWSIVETGANLFTEVFDVCSLSSLLLAVALVPIFDGGGDFSRGEVGHEGEFGPDLICLSVLRVPSSTPSTPEGGRIGLWADSAR